MKDDSYFSESQQIWIIHSLHCIDGLQTSSISNIFSSPSLSVILLMKWNILHSLLKAQSITGDFLELKNKCPKITFTCTTLYIFPSLLQNYNATFSHRPLSQYLNECCYKKALNFLKQLPSFSMNLKTNFCKRLLMFNVFL